MVFNCIVIVRDRYYHCESEILGSRSVRHRALLKRAISPNQPQSPPTSPNHPQSSPITQNIFTITHNHHQSPKTYSKPPKITKLNTNWPQPSQNKLLWAHRIHPVFWSIISTVQQSSRIMEWWNDGVMKWRISFASKKLRMSAVLMELSIFDITIPPRPSPRFAPKICSHSGAFAS